jgi:hypothetical protein
MTVGMAYVFNGRKLIEYSHYQDFKDRLTADGINVTGGTIQSIYEEIVSQQPAKISEVSKIYFENVFYGQLKNVYYQKISNRPPDKADFINKSRSIITNRNRKDTIPPQYHTLFSENGFYALDYLDVGNKGNIFILGYDYDEDEENNKIKVARYLIAQVVLRNEVPVYYLAALEINYAEQLYLLMFRNMQGIDAVPTDQTLLEEDKWNRSINGYIQKINQMFLNPLGIRNVFRHRTDREGMYNMCKELDDGLLQEYRESIAQQIGNDVENSINSWFSTLDEGANEPSDEQKKSLKDKVSSQVQSGDKFSR